LVAEQHRRTVLTPYRGGGPNPIGQAKEPSRKKNRVAREPLRRLQVPSANKGHDGE
jgi:hypothetical protein